MGKIADILQRQGDLDGSLRIQSKEVLPVFERLGAARDLVFVRWNLGFTLLRRRSATDREPPRARGARARRDCFAALAM